MQEALKFRIILKFTFFFSCPTESDPRKVQFFWNEKLIRDLDFCDNGLCNIEQVLSKYERFLNASCDSVTCSGSMK